MQWTTLWLIMMATWSKNLLSTLVIVLYIYYMYTYNIYSNVLKLIKLHLRSAQGADNTLIILHWKLQRTPSDKVLSWTFDNILLLISLHFTLQQTICWCGFSNCIGGYAAPPAKHQMQFDCRGLCRQRMPIATGSHTRNLTLTFLHHCHHHGRHWKHF